MSDRSPKQELEYVDFARGQLASVLDIQLPPLSSAKALNQLRYLERYLARPEMGCRSALIEHHYVDRDHMEDHSVFYSRSILQYPGYCRRLHFFRTPVSALGARLKEIGNHASEGAASYKSACLKFSHEDYLGFAVIKPLHGSPVGRTVLRCFPEEAAGGAVRLFHGARRYTAHVLGVELVVNGLAFQQQDVGVAACATTALWSSLQKARELEDFGTATPAQITKLAVQHNLEFGRAMPSEGLSTQQMCAAIEAVGMSSVLVRTSSLQRNFEVAQGLMYSAVRSRLAPVLVIEKHRTDQRHAVTVVGMKLTNVGEQIAEGLHDTAARLMALYVHDDRHGPYLRADVMRGDQGIQLRMEVSAGREQDTTQLEDWTVTHLIVPLHAKIRLSLVYLRLVGLDFAKDLRALMATTDKPRLITFDTWVERSHTYLEELLLESRVSPSRVHKLAGSVAMSRYLGIARAHVEGLSPLDLLVDTTSTAKNANFLGVFPHDDQDIRWKSIVAFGSQKYRCKAVA